MQLTHPMFLINCRPLQMRRTSSLHASAACSLSRQKCQLSRICLTEAASNGLIQHLSLGWQP